MTTAAIIPARGGSKRLPNKNIIDCHGMPLIAWSIKHALEAKCVDEVYVSTDSGTIADVAGKYGAKLIQRPKYLAEDRVSSEDVLLHAAMITEADRFVFLQCTSPMRFPDDIDRANACMGCAGRDTEDNSHQIDSVYSANIIDGFIHRHKMGQRHIGPGAIEENGSIYIIDRKTFLQRESRFGQWPVAFLQHPACRFQVDYLDDLDWIRHLMSMGGAEMEAVVGKGLVAQC